MVEGDEALTTNSGASCKDLATDGIKDWAGTYTGVYGETVTVNVNVHEGDSSIWKNQKYVKIYLENGTGIPHAYYEGTEWNDRSGKIVKMYREDPRNANPYSDNEYRWTVAHEMGHVFGLDDGYPAIANWFEAFFGIQVRPDAASVIGGNDIMRNQFSGVNISSYNIEMLILAYSSGQFQSYFDYWGHDKSSCLP